MEDEGERLLAEKKSIEEQKHLEEDVRVQTQEFKRNKQVSDSLRRA